VTAREMFVGADGRPRALWRLILFIVLVVACSVVVFTALAVPLSYLERVNGLQGTSEATGLTVSLLLAHWLALRFLDRRPVSSVWMGVEAARPRALLYGFALGALPIAAATLALVLGGQLDVADAPEGAWLNAALRVTLLLAPAALYEELFSRGYIFVTLGRWLGWPVAVALTSIAFGLLHVPNPGADPLPIVMVTLAGVYLAVVLLATRSLYAAWMAHLGWNWVMAVVLHVAVSGLPFPRPGYEIVDDGPDWLTGGAWGPEGGVAAGAGMLGAMAYLYWRHARRTNEHIER